VANTLLTINMITNEALAVLENQLTATKYINRQYDDSFGRSGAKIGDTLNIRKPPRYIGRTGQAISIEDSVETSVPLALTTQRGVDIQFSSSDLALRIDMFSERFIKPAMVQVANAIDLDVLTLMKNSTYNSVGTPGTALSSGDILLDAGATLDDNATPRGDLRSAVFGPRSSAGIIKGLKSIFNDGQRISNQYDTGNLGPLYGLKTSMDQNVIKHVVGPLGGTPLVNGASQTGSTLVTDGWTASAASRLKKGDVFTIAGVFSVNPVSRQTTNQLQQFVVTADVSSDGSGNASIPISPAITPTGQFQNVTASPADNAALTVVGAANTVTEQNIAFHRDAFTLACADLPLPGGVDMAARKSDPQTGLSVRAVRAYNVSTDQFPMRLDILYGVAALYPEWACRIQA
jgi:hypothetical protein